MATYGIIYLDNYHCLKCGSISHNLKRMEVPFKAKGNSVSGHALLCPKCTERVKVARPITLRDILTPAQVADMQNNDNSPYCEVIDADYWDKIRRPALQIG